MMKTGLKMVLAGLLLVAIAVVAGCGGTGAASGASMNITLASTTLDSGTSTSGTVQFSGTTSLNGIRPAIKTDKPSIISGSAQESTSTGASYVIIQATNATSDVIKCKVWAEYEGLVSNIVEVTVNPGVGTGALSLAVNNTSPVPGTLVQATVQYTNSNTAASLANVPVTITSSHPTVIPNASGTTLSDGKVSINISVAASAPVSTQVVLTATAVPGDGTTVNAAPVTLTIAASNSLTLAMGADATFERKAAVSSPAATGNIVVQGNKITFTGPQGVIKDQPITLSIDRIDNWASGDLVTLNGKEFTKATPAGSIPLTTDSTGTAQVPTVITVLMPSAPATAGASVSHVYVIYWRATTAYGGADYVVTGSTLVTGTTTAE